MEQLEQRVGALEQRVGALEAARGTPSVAPSGLSGMFSGFTNSNGQPSGATNETPPGESKGIVGNIKGVFGLGGSRRKSRRSKKSKKYRR